MSSNPKGSHLMNGKETNKGKGFDNNPENINKKGQPRKGINFLSEKIKEKIGKTPSKKQIEDITIGIGELTEQELNDIVNDKDSAMNVKIIAKELLDNNKAFNAFNVLVDRGYGKAMQRSETETTGDINLKIDKTDVDNMSDNELEELRKKLIK